MASTMTTVAIGWTCGVLGVTAGVLAALGSLLDLLPIRACMFFIAISIMCFGLGCLMVMCAESGRRAARATQRAFDLGVTYARQKMGTGATITDIGRGDAA